MTLVVQALNHQTRTNLVYIPFDSLVYIYMIEQQRHINSNWPCQMQYKLLHPIRFLYALDFILVNYFLVHGITKLSRKI